MATEIFNEFICPKCLKKAITSYYMTSADAEGDSDWCHTFHCENCGWTVESFESASRFRDPEEQEELKAKALYLFEKTKKQEELIRIDFSKIDDGFVKYFAEHPNDLYQINPRMFEELVAFLLEGMGYEVELTSRGPDGGIDIMATQKTNIGEMLVVIDCKRYKSDRKIGVELVRGLYGITEQHQASMGMLVTTSFFTKPAQQFQEKICHKISLRDYNDLIVWLENHKKV